MSEKETRRDFAKIAVGGAALLSAASKVNAKMPAVPPGIKIGTSAGQPTEENLLYLKQLGVKWVSLGVRPEDATAEGFIKIRETWEAAGFKVYNIGSGVGPPDPTMTGTSTTASSGRPGTVPRFATSRIIVACSSRAIARISASATPS